MKPEDEVELLRQVQEAAERLGNLLANARPERSVNREQVAVRQRVREFVERETRALRNAIHARLLLEFEQSNRVKLTDSEKRENEA